jgi:hypothetical protein
MEYTEDNIELVAEAMIRRMEVQDLLSDAFNSLVEIYRVSPEHFISDSITYETDDVKYIGPFMGLIDYFKDVIIDEGVEQNA